MITATGLLALCLLQPPQDAGPASPRVSQASFVHAPALNVRLVAAEPDVVAPVAVGWDMRRDLWVLCGDGRLVVRHDGAFHEFAHDLESASGLLLLGSEPLVALPGAVVRLLDEDGDGSADRRVEILSLADGARLEELQLGLDGRVVALSAEGVVRFDPRDGRLEILAHREDARGLALSVFGEVFVAGDEAHFMHLVAADGLFSAGRVGDVASLLDTADHTFVERLAERTGPSGSVFGRPGGATFLAGAPWTFDLEGDYVVCEPADGILHTDAVSPWGVTFRGRRTGAGELLASRDPNFRPSAVALGPEGVLLVLDRYADDPARGRLWELRLEHGIAAGTLPSLPPADLSGDELLIALTARDRWTREAAHGLLRERLRADRELADELRRRTLQSPDALLRLHALWLLPEATDLELATLSSFEPGLRANALRAFRSGSPANGRKLTPENTRTLAGDANGRVRLEALFAWRRIADSPSQSRLVELYPGLEDDWSRSAAVAVAAEAPATHLAAALRRPDGDRLHSLVRHVAADVARRADLRDAVEMVLALAGGDHSPRLVAVVLEELARGSFPRAPWSSPRLSTTLRRLAGHGDPRVATAALPLARSWLGPQLGPSELEGWNERVLDVLENPRDSVARRLAGFEALLAVPEARERALAVALDGAGQPPFAHALLDALADGRAAETELGDTLEDLLRHEDPEVASHAVNALATARKNSGGR